MQNVYCLPFCLWTGKFTVFAYSSEGSEITNSTCIFLDWFSQPLNRVLDSCWILRKPPEKTELAKCLEKFYLSTDKNRGSTKQLLSEALELAGKISFSITTDPEFLQANKALYAFVKILRKDGEIACVEIKEKLLQSVQLVLADTTNPSQLQNTIWF